MDLELVEEILSCPSLPSLPAVALRVIEQTSNPNVKLPELAETIQTDQALAAKVLRTVNSSFYGLRQRCASINKALVMLGLGPVKSLALGFSLIGSVGQTSDDGFDYPAYWRRGLITAIAAKIFAEAAGKKFADEAFLAGLLQDVGMVALHRALNRRYLVVLAATQGDHRRLVKAELADLEIQHPDIGAMLCQRWRLPDELVVPVKYHERPTAAPQQYVEIVRCVGLGNLAHDALSDPEPANCLRRLYTRGEEWLGFTSDQMQSLTKRIGQSVNEMAGLFRLDVGTHLDPEALVAAAEQQLLDLPASPADTVHGEVVGNVLVDASLIDPVTGTVGRQGFEAAVTNGLSLSQSSGEPVTLAQIAVEGLSKLISLHGPEHTPRITNSVITLLRKHFDVFGGAVCRLGGDLFAVVMFGAGSRAATVAAEEFCTGIDRAASYLQPANLPPPQHVALRASIGLASQLPADGIHFTSPAEFVTAAVNALKLARLTPGSAVRTAEYRLAA